MVTFNSSTTWSYNWLCVFPGPVFVVGEVGECVAILLFTGSVNGLVGIVRVVGTEFSVTIGGVNVRSLSSRLCKSSIFS